MDIVKIAKQVKFDIRDALVIRLSDLGYNVICGDYDIGIQQLVLTNYPALISVFSSLNRVGTIEVTNSDILYKKLDNTVIHKFDLLEDFEEHLYLEKWYPV